MVPDLDDPELREELARAAYYRERQADLAADQEHEMSDDAQYFCIQWESLSSWSQRPYRMGVDTALEHLKAVV